ncbi:MAG: FAD-dependent oxidoreductase [Deltaproteobacteria bacterium]|nr:FAD-dependent oxidoreductase [Deltaproteobacteria bacterium]
MAQEFKNLLSPINIGPLTLRNRIVSSSHHPLFINPATGLLDDRMVNYWVAKAKGGIGLIETYLTTTHVKVALDTFRRPGVVEAFRRAADAVHEHGAKLICQIASSGAQGGGFGASSPWAPSPVLTPDGQGHLNCPHEMTHEEVKEFVKAFAHAATVAREAGTDGVQIHGAHGYLLTEFMSPSTNKRTDEYGGSLENRMRFALEIIEATRSAVGKDFVVGIRVSADEFVPGGFTLDDFLEMATILDRTGMLDYMSVSTGTYRTIGTAIESMYYPLNSFVYCAAAVKQVVDIPVVARGRIQDPVQAEEILASNQADMVSMVRPIIADPELPNKAMDGRLDEIAKCIGCNEACWGTIYFSRMLTGGISCTMNPAIGKEGEPGWSELIPAEKKKQIMVIGGGPAGLEAARVAAGRGHQVSLYEAGSELGGQTLIAAKAPGRDGFLDLGRYYTYQMNLLNIDLHLNTEVSIEMVKEQNPDAVIVATGSVPLIPDIPGITGDNVVNVWQVLNREVEVGNNVVVIGDDDLVASLSTADFIAEQGKKVEFLCWGYFAGAKVEPATREAIYQRLLQKGVILSPQTIVNEISDNTVITMDRFTNEERRIEGVDTVVVACGGRENNALYYNLKDQVDEIYVVGDANGIRKVHNATMDGATVGRTV